MNQQEIKRIDDVTKQLKELNKNIKDSNDIQKRNFSNTNKNTMLHELVKSIESIATNISDLTKSVDKLTHEVVGIKKKIN